MTKNANQSKSFSILNKRKQNNTVQCEGDKNLLSINDQHTLTLDRQFTLQAKNHPNKIAIECGNEKLTYEQYEQKASLFANKLRQAGVSYTHKVVVCLERNIDFFVSILAILKVGACYIPLDHQCPEKRLRYILSNSGANLLITSRSKGNPDIDIPTINHTELSMMLKAPVANNAVQTLPVTDIQSTPDKLAYIIYTSGSTGKPKGVMIEHQNVMTYINAAKAAYQISVSDRVYHGFSVAFDAAIEEIWLTLLCGATLVVADENTRKMADSAAQFIRKNNITVLSTVPSFLSLITSELPAVRLIITGGEVLSSKLVSKWATTKRRVLNTYGPTETSVVATYAECTPEHSVVIGKPLQGYTVYVCDNEGCQVAQGEKGELWISGSAVGRGYINSPILTDEKFIENPFTLESERLYKTGDKVLVNQNGDIEFCGRIDNQIKIRGYRVNLDEIENILLEQTGVIAAVVIALHINGIQKIAAYFTEDSTNPVSEEGLFEQLKQTLPPYMMPDFMEKLDAFPTLPSGKINKKALPAPNKPFVNKNRDKIPPTTLTEKLLAEVFMEVFQHNEISVTDHFFNDVGGDSLLAAHFITSLSKKINGKEVSIRDIYQYPTIEKFAHFLDTNAQKKACNNKKTCYESSTKDVIESVSGLTQKFVVFMQFISVLFMLSLISFPLTFSVVLIKKSNLGQLPWHITIPLLSCMIIIWPMLSMLLSVIAKWIVVGKYYQGDYPVGSFYYFRHWFVSKMVTISGYQILKGTPLINVYLRLMGASIGKHAIINTSVFQAFDLIRIGENCSVNSHSHLAGVKVEHGFLKVGSVTLGDNTFVGCHTYISLNTVMEKNSAIDDYSILDDNQTITINSFWSGSPARQESNKPEFMNADPLKSVHRPVMYGLCHLLFIYIQGLLISLSLAPASIFIYEVFQLHSPGLLLLSTIFSVLMSVIIFCLLVVAFKRLLTGKITEGVYEVNSFFYVKNHAVHNLIEQSRVFLLPIYATLYVVPWLRMLGAKLGKSVEVSTIADISPDLITVDKECFLADAAIIGGMRLYNGQMLLDKISICERSFVGNGAFVPGGSKIKKHCLIGCLSLPPKENEDITESSSWLGSPSFSLHNRQNKINFDQSRLYKPSKWLYIQRLLIDAVRIVLPGVLSTLTLCGFVYSISVEQGPFSFIDSLALSSVDLLMLFISNILIVAAIKWLFFKKYKSVVKPLWCRYIWFNEMINGLYESIFAPIVNLFTGTPLAGCLLRLMGCRIGKKTYIGSTLFSEFDLVKIEDYACINTGATIQTHLFEDRIMKSGQVTIKEGATVGSMSIVLYNAVLNNNAILSPMSLLMKGEDIPENQKVMGVPVKR